MSYGVGSVLTPAILTSLSSTLYAIGDQPVFGDDPTPVTPIVSDWENNPFYTNCGPWNRNRAIDETIEHAVRIYDSIVNDIEFYMIAKCKYLPCSNLEALSLGDIDTELYQIEQLNRLETVTYLVHKEELVVDLEPIYAFCFNHNRIQELKHSVMILPDGSEVQLEDEAEINKYGFSIDQRNTTSTLRIFLDDETMYDH